ncbi:uncharacterized protein LOC143909666 [Arctopsyche grandis]|uniref:uncharacterized protein LOC143909666 n=1 Tax=Arctopsyche grandis TaxID=121162 RepID=UPI00406D6496
MFTSFVFVDFEKHATNSSNFATNNSRSAPSANHKPFYRNHTVHSDTNHDDNYYDSLNCNDVNRNHRNPYDIPANLNSKYISNYMCKLDDLNSGASEFMKKRHGQFEMLSGKNEAVNNNTRRGYAFTIDSGGIDGKKSKNSDSKNIQSAKNSKVFDRLFPHANDNASEIKNSNRNFTLNLVSNVDVHSNVGTKGNNDKSVIKNSKARSILKNYKSCPVSPVSEECKWGDINAIVQTNPVENVGLPRRDHPTYNQGFKDMKKRNSLSYFMDFDTTSHLMKDNGKSLVDTIKSDTEKMIAEITKKYGDLDEYEPKVELKYKINEDKIELPEIQNEKEDGNFSSDSLEDCSLSQDFNNRNKVYTKRICKKHHKNSVMSSMARRCVSDYEIYGAMDEKNANCTNRHIELINMQVVQYDIRQQKSFTLPKNMPSNLDDYSDEFYYGSQEQITNQRNNNFQRCSSALTKRCVTRSNESIMTDENSNCSSVSNEIFMKCGDQNAFSQRKLVDKQYFDDSQNCSYENLCYEADAAYLERHRHSSASFFLNQRKVMKNSASQESVLSDDLLPSDSDNQLMSKTNCNSLESILSDDSEYTKSAPLEMLFEHKRHSRKPEICSSVSNAVVIPKNSQSCYEFDQSSKSYGSSPNNSSNFGAYMYHNPPFSGTCNRNDYNSALLQDNSACKTVTRSVSLQDSTANKRNIAYYFDGSEIKEFDKPRTDEIPSMRSKNQEYESHQRKSLLTNCEEKYKYLCNLEGMETTCINKSKSCSFEVLMELPGSARPLPKRITEKTMSHVQKNLEKFESQIRKNAEAKMQKSMINRQSNNNPQNKITSKMAGVTKSLERNTGQGGKNSNGKPPMEFVPHKPPKPVKRTSSVKLTNRNRFSKPSFDKYSGLDTGLGANVRAKIDGLQLKHSIVSKKIQNDSSSDVDNDNKPILESSAEKSFNVYVAEKDVVDNKSEMQMDSLEYIALQKKSDKASDISLDSLDILDERHPDTFSKDSLNYESYGESSKFDSSHTNLNSNNQIKISVTNKNMPFLKIGHKASSDGASTSEFKASNVGSSIDSLKLSSSEDVTMFKDIERKIDIINKLVEMEERKILQERYLKECRMRPLKANFSDGKGTVKILSRNFEKLASKHQSKDTLDASDFFSLTYDDCDSDSEKNTIKKEIKRNLSLPDVLDGEKMDLISCLEEKHVNNECGNMVFDNNSVEPSSEATLNNVANLKTDDTGKCADIKTKDLKRVYNVTVIPKTDIHLDSENYESSTTSSSCANSPKRLFFKQKTSSKISSLFRNKFDRGRFPVTAVNFCKSGSKPVIAPSGKVVSLISSNAGLAKKLSLQQSILPSKMAFVQGLDTADAIRCMLFRIVSVLSFACSVYLLLLLFSFRQCVQCVYFSFWSCIKSDILHTNFTCWWL